MAFKDKISSIPLTSIDSATVSGTYQAINSSGLDNPCFLIRIINDSSQDVTISYDGTTDNDYLRTTETLSLPFQTNARPSNFVANIPKGTKVYVKGTAGTGAIYLAGYYSPVL